MLSRGLVPPSASVPPAAERILGIFWHLDGLRPPSMAGVSPLPLSEVRAWASLTGESLAPWEVDCLMHMDRARLRGPVPLAGPAKPDTEELSADSFDAMFGGPA